MGSADVYVHFWGFSVEKYGVFGPMNREVDD